MNFARQKCENCISNIYHQL